MSITAAANTEPLLRQDATMRYRPLGRTGLMVSALSMGCMRLGADQELNAKLVARAIELGINYFETTRWYCGGQCQQRTAPGLAGKTKGLIVSGKCGIGPDTTAFGFRQEIELQLGILGLSHFKFFQVGWFAWGLVPHLLKRGGVLAALRQAKDEGLVQYVGFTGHDRPENFVTCVETGLFDCITVPYNLIQRAYEPTIKRAGELGVGVIAMCPVAGGVLASESPAFRQALKLDLPTPAMALRFVLSNPDVSSACSGMSALAMLEENARTVKAFDPEQDRRAAALGAGVERLRRKLDGQICTACGYCQPCPRQVDVPRYMSEYTNWKCYGLDGWVKDTLAQVPAERRLARCDGCGACEKKCPNKIPVRSRLAGLRRLLREVQARRPPVAGARRRRRQAPESPAGA